MRELLFQEDPDITDSAADFALTFRSEIGEDFSKWKRKAQEKRESGVVTYSLYGIEVDLEDGIYKCYELKNEENGIDSQIQSDQNC